MSDWGFVYFVVVDNEFFWVKGFDYFEVGKLFFKWIVVVVVINVFGVDGIFGNGVICFNFWYVLDGIG